MFKTLPIARTCCRVPDLPGEAGSYHRDTVTLGWEERLKARARRRSDGGFEFATALPRGTALAAGDCLVFPDDRLVIQVIELEEQVFVIRPTSPAEWALFGYHIGNCHQPMMLDDETIVCADLPGMVQALDYHAIPFTRARRAFTPVGQAPEHQHSLLI